MDSWLALCEGQDFRPAVRRDSRHDPAINTGGPGFSQMPLQVIESIKVKMCIKGLDHDLQIVPQASASEQSQ
jgi:hypothetical protein